MSIRSMSSVSCRRCSSSMERVSSATGGLLLPRMGFWRRSRRLADRRGFLTPSNVDCLPLDGMGRLLDNLRQSGVGEYGIGDIGGRGLQGHGQRKAADQLGHVRPDHVDAEDLAVTLLCDHLDKTNLFLA